MDGKEEEMIKWMTEHWIISSVIILIVINVLIIAIFCFSRRRQKKVFGEEKY